MSMFLKAIEAYGALKAISAGMKTPVAQQMAAQAGHQVGASFPKAAQFMGHVADSFAPQAAQHAGQVSMPSLIGPGVKTVAIGATAALMGKAWQVTKRIISATLGGTMDALKMFHPSNWKSTLMNATWYTLAYSVFGFFFAGGLHLVGVPAVFAGGIGIDAAFRFAGGFLKRLFPKRPAVFNELSSSVGQHWQSLKQHIAAQQKQAAAMATHHPQKFPGAVA